MTKQPITWTVYRLAFKGDSKFALFGATSSFYKSMYFYHFQNLEEGTHCNKPFQSLYNEHGFGKLEFIELKTGIASKDEAKEAVQALRLEHKETLLIPANNANV